MTAVTITTTTTTTTTTVSAMMTCALECSGDERLHGIAQAKGNCLHQSSALVWTMLSSRLSCSSFLIPIFTHLQCDLFDLLALSDWERLFALVSKLVS